MTDQVAAHPPVDSRTSTSITTGWSTSSASTSAWPMPTVLRISPS
ncbi:hypothetical protein [Streptomyces cinerochromogenes]